MIRNLVGGMHGGKAPWRSAFFMTSPTTTLSTSAKKTGHFSSDLASELYQAKTHIAKLKLEEEKKSRGGSGGGRGGEETPSRACRKNRDRSEKNRDRGQDSSRREGLSNAGTSFLCSISSSDLDSTIWVLARSSSEARLEDKHPVFIAERQRR